MILGIDIGNTSIELALLSENGSVMRKHRFATEKKESIDYYIKNIRIFSDNQSVSGIAVSSVVPEINNLIEKSCEKIFCLKPLFVTCDINTGLRLKYDNPAKLGADLITAAAGAAVKYKLPAIVVDIGTATTFSVLNEKAEYLGGMIAAGPCTSMKALSAMASQLPEIEMTAAEKTIGTNTRDCIRIGTITAHAAMIDGMVDRVKESIGFKDITVAATGGFAEMIIGMCAHKIIFDENLIFTGLYEIYKLNSKPQ